MNRRGRSSFSACLCLEADQVVFMSTSRDWGGINGATQHNVGEWRGGWNLKEHIWIHNVYINIQKYANAQELPGHNIFLLGKCVFHELKWMGWGFTFKKYKTEDMYFLEKNK